MVVRRVEHGASGTARRVLGLTTLARDLAKALTIQDVARAVLHHGIEVTGARGGAMVLADGASRALHLVGAQGRDTRLIFPAKRCRLSAHIPLAMTARTGQPLWFPSSEDFQSHFPRLPRAQEDVGIACVPLVRAGIPLGAVGFVVAGPHAFGPAERAFIHSLSRHCLDALNRALLHEDERGARKGAENAAARLERLQHVTEALCRAVHSAEIAEIVTQEALEGTQARACFLAVWENGQPKILAESGVTKEAMAQARRAFERYQPTVMNSQAPLWPEPDAQSDIDAGAPPTSKNQFACIPVIIGGRLLCALGLKLRKKRRLQNAAQVFLCALAGLCGQAIERARLYEAERAARERAEAASRMKDEFLGIVSHELRTPLAAISCWVALLQRRQPMGDELARALDSIGRNTTMQARLVEDLLDASRIVSDKLRIEIEVVDLAAVLASAQEALAQAASDKPLELRVVLPENPVPPVRGDALRLEQVVRNLISNAIKFTPAGGLVEVRLSRMQGTARIEVTDTGQGIVPALLPHIFERFRQGDATSTRRHGGLGLGLSIVRSLVEAHGGRVSAHSDGHDRGTKMTVDLPFEQATRNRGEARLDEKIAILTHGASIEKAI
jgi:hypothetical protein